ncbi:hypothetical protein BJV74DRAFT_881806 [Russula compacta]|nr:hypothetical protein BJV74DRAFT_881806 [Russula compacta]
MAILDKITTSYSPAAVPSPYLIRALYLVATLALGRFTFYANPEHLEEAILRYRFHLDALSLEDPRYHSAIQILEQLERRRFEEFGVTNSLQELHFRVLEDIPSISNLGASLVKSKSSPMTDANRVQRFQVFESTNRITDIVDIEEAAKHFRVFLVHMGQLKQAIETLEQGRGLLWSEMRGLHASVNQPSIVDVALAEKFAAVNRDLEALTTSCSSSAWMSDGEIKRLQGLDPFGHIVMKHRKLAEERSRLILYIQSFPGFESFLKAPIFETVRSAAARGSVIIVNHCEWCSDIIILLRDSSPPPLIPTANNFYSRANELSSYSMHEKKGSTQRDTRTL